MTGGGGGEGRLMVETSREQTLRCLRYVKYQIPPYAKWSTSRIRRGLLHLVSMTVANMRVTSGKIEGRALG